MGAGPSGGVGGLWAGAGPRRVGPGGGKGRAEGGCRRAVGRGGAEQAVGGQWEGAGLRGLWAGSEEGRGRAGCT